MPPFSDYSRYYDLLYADKDYDAEAAGVTALLDRFGSSPRRLLELGCGTGRHARCLADRGYHITGIERSDSMLHQAQQRAVAAEAGEGRSGSFTPLPGDARSVRLDVRFDAVLSLFHVVSYQTSADDVDGLFETVACHLEPGGLFVFDVWYGPAVLFLRPQVRVRRIEDDRISVVRIAEPALDENACRVDVDYTVFVTDRRTGTVEQLQERHRMRYFFRPELERIAAAHGLHIVHSEEWMTGKPPSQNTWGVCFVAARS